ncbi:MAG TPA: lytic transglycosylase domain-containing protein [Gammaproteobacteria bacterium]|nr:lytic transglycosylase domain-containing protein [Gammaproteobacteria bacterium]
MQPPRLISKTLALITLLAITSHAHARELEVPVRLSQALNHQYLVSQVYTEMDGTARMWHDGCNSLVLSNPQVEVKAGVVRVTSAAQAQVGTAVGDNCLVMLNWTGFVDVLEQPVLSTEPGVVELWVMDSKVYSQDGESVGITGTVWDWIKQYAHPRLERVKLDLNPTLNELESLLPLVFPNDQVFARHLLDSVKLSKVKADDGHVTLTIRLDIPQQNAPIMRPSEHEPPLTADELQHWAEVSRNLDAFLTQIIKVAGAGLELKARRLELLEVLLDARRDVLEILASPPRRGADPVRKLFAKTWSRLAPILRAESRNFPPELALRWLSFITAADALKTLDELTPDLGFTLSADALRRLARIALPKANTDALDFDLKVDPELRRALGFGPPLRPPWRHPNADLSVLSFFVNAARAEDPEEALVERLTGWLPSLDTIDEYLPMVGKLLNLAVDSALSDGELASAYQDIYRNLVLATAWQESCWRQFVESNDKYVPINSGNGSVGIMQVNQYVWRGFYDVDGLNWDIGYNARAGAEILRHYLVDYAIAQDEAAASGDMQNLARATYAMYNGGPSQMTRYRDPTVPESARAIDQAFWQKFQIIRKGNPHAVAVCYADEQGDRLAHSQVQLSTRQP